MSAQRSTGRGMGGEVTTQPQPNRAISGHLRLREGKRGATWYAKYRGPARLPDGLHLEFRLAAGR